MRGPDPRADPAPLTAVPGLLAEGAAHYAARRFWHAHEAWESAWHALRAVKDPRSEYVHGLILATAAFENATRGKELGFKRQMAEALHLLRTNRAAAVVREAAAFEDALLELYVDACRRRDWGAWNASGWTAPPLAM